MKKFLALAIVLGLTVLFAGCGQEMDVTVYNTSGIICSGGLDQTYIQMTADISNVGGTNITFFPSGYCQTESECDMSNSFTLLGKENEVLHLYARGQYYNVDSSGNTSIVTFSVEPVSQILYGELLAVPHWYAAVFTNAIVIYKK